MGTPSQVTLEGARRWDSPTKESQTVASTKKAAAGREHRTAATLVIWATEQATGPFETQCPWSTRRPRERPRRLLHPSGPPFLPLGSKCQGTQISLRSEEARSENPIRGDCITARSAPRPAQLGLALVRQTDKWPTARSGTGTVRLTFTGALTSRTSSASRQASVCVATTDGQARGVGGRRPSENGACRHHPRSSATLV